MKNNNNLGIYIHIPFCKKKCNYCDFLSFPADENSAASYIAALVSEIKAYGKLYGRHGLEKRTISSVFFGGGTPSILNTKYIKSIIDVLHESFDFYENPEITIECNPGTLNYDKLCDYRGFGINRLSIGLQSACDSELITLGRIHSYPDFVESMKNARRAGFDNINIDIMSALPGQTLDSYGDTLNKVLSFSPEHISSYSLIIEECTPFYNIYNDYNINSCYPPLPDEDTEREMYYMTGSILSDNGYNRYEISNYSLSGKECRHNMLYWQRGDYLGFGLGASSFINNTRYKNVSVLKQYISLLSGNIDMANSRINIPALTEESQLLSLNDSMSEYMFLGLRMMSGISKRNFMEYFGRDINDVFGKQLEKFKSEGLISENQDNIFLTNYGIDVSNYVFSQLIL